MTPANLNLVTAKFAIKSGASGSADFTITDLVIADENTDDHIAESGATKTGATYIIPKAPIASVTASVETPVAGAALDTSVDLDGATAYTGAVEWYVGETEATETIAKANTKYTAKITLTASSGESFADSVTVPTGYTKDSSSTSSKLVLTKTFDKTGSLPAASVGTAPAAKSSLEYDGTEQELVNAGTATNGTMQYSLDNSSWSDAIPKGKNAGEYTVYYMVKGDSSHSDYTPSPNTVTVKIDPKGITSVTIDPIPNQTYTGNAIEPPLVVKDGTTTLTKGKDYTVSYHYNHTDAGSRALQVDGMGNYTGTKGATFIIDRAEQVLTVPGTANVAFGTTLDLNTVCSSNVPGAVLTFAKPTTASTPTGTTFDATTGIVTAGNNTGSFNVTVDSAGNANYKDALQKTITVYIVEKTPSTYATEPTAKTGLKYDGTEQELVTAGVANGGTVKYSLDGTTWTDTVPTGKDAKTYDVQYKIVGDATHKDTAPHTRTVEIGRKEVTVSGITAENKKYDGNDSATVNAAGATFDGIVSGDTLTITATGTFANADADNGKTVNLTLGTLSGASVGNYKLAATGNQTTTTADITPRDLIVTPNAGQSKKFGAEDPTLHSTNSGRVTGQIPDFTGALSRAEGEDVGQYDITLGTLALIDHFSSGFKASNYTLKMASPAVKFEITKADARTLADIPVSQKYTVTTEQSKDIGNGGMPADAGTLTYAKGAESKTGSVAIDSWDVNATGKVTYTLSGGAAGDTVTLPVTIGSDNYENSTVNVKITLTAKDDQAALTLTGGTTVVYGQTLQLGTSGGSGTGAVTYAVTNGTGEATIDAAGKLTPVKVGTVKVKATKAEDANYNAITSAEVEITIKQATSTGEPKYTAITTSGKTLADAGLTTTGSTLNPNAGTLVWVDNAGNVLPGTTTVEANTTYKWRFTPADANYTTLTGSIELYHKSTSSGGGGSYYAPVVPDMPMVYRGCTGDAVKTLQDKLNTLGYNSGNVDGIFGAKTYAAVTAFQKANGLGVDGIVGKLTWGKLYGVSPAMPVETTTVVGRPMVSYGSRGDTVRKLQELLNALGHDCGSVDGIFGSKTKAAVLAFQKANGLGADGIVGPLTWAKLG